MFTLTDLLLRGVEGLAHVLNLFVLGRDGRDGLVKLLFFVLKACLQNILER